MATLLYIHGFLSSPLSFKAQQTKQWLSEHRPDINYLCPQLTPYPNECYTVLNELIENCDGDIYLVGSSMGGFWADYFSEKHQLKAVLVNPAVEALQLMPKYVGQLLKSYHSETHYVLSEAHIAALKPFASHTITTPENIWLMVQTGDETLDYTAAVKRYPNCKQTIEQGGNHSFEQFDRHLADIIDFFEQA